MPATQVQFGTAKTAARCQVSTKTTRRRLAGGTLTGYRLRPTLVRLDPAEVDAPLRPILTAVA